MPSSLVARTKPFVLVLVALVVAAVPAGASLILASPDETSGTGLGAVNTVLTIQNDPTESGCVGWNGTMTVVGPAACPPGIAGGDETAINETRTLGELGLTSAFNLRVVFNYNEDNTDDITLEDMVLRIYAPDGTVLFSSEPFSPVTFPEPFSGTGTSGFVFRLDAQQAAEANQYFDDPNNRVGLAAEASQTSAGPETFYIGDAAAVSPAEADVSVVKSDSPDPIAVGSTLTYTITVTNDGPNRATGVTVTDTLPASVTFVSASSPDGTCSQSGRIVTCDLGTVASGDTATVTIVVETTTDGVITDDVSVSADQADPNPGNNTDTEQTTVGTPPPGQVDLAITKSDSPDPVQVGDTLTYTLTIENNGATDATGVTVTDALPQTVTFESASSPDGSCDNDDDDQTVSCDLGTVTSGATAVITIEVTPQQEGQITNSASVSADQSDSNPADNRATEQTQVGTTAGSPAAADLVLTKSDSADPVATGQTLVYTLNVDNDGPNVATNVSVTDTLPASFDFLSAIPTQGTCSESGGIVNCDLGTLGSGDSASVEIRVRPTMEGSFTNTAAVSAEQNDPDPADNSAAEETTVDDAAAVPIPTAGTWALLALGLLLGGAAVWRLGSVG